MSNYFFLYICSGVRGLKKALSKFDPEKGFAFSTYAYPWIREYIRSALASSLPIALPRHVYKLLLKVRTVQEQMSQLTPNRLPTDEEIAAEMGIPIERFEIVRRAMALAAHSSDNTPPESSGARIQFDEATWERVFEANMQGR
jgi:DNA-directed RNA polymerase sigma subunit (sigma70/sigma32)